MSTNYAPLGGLEDYWREWSWMIFRGLEAYGNEQD